MRAKAIRMPRKRRWVPRKNCEVRSKRQQLKFDIVKAGRELMHKKK
jgi:hypothetical protein